MSYTPPAQPQPYLPDISGTTKTFAELYMAVQPSTIVASRDSINSVASAPEDQQLQVAAANAPLRVIYGPARVGAQLADALTYQGKLILLLVWGEGEIEAVDSLEMDDAALPAGVTATNYTGTAGQAADPTLVAAYASHGITYTDTLAGIAYSVASVTESASAGFPTFTARIRGRKLYDPRTTLTAYSDCPALALADLQTNTLYGFAKNVIWGSVTTVANDNDALVGTEKRRLIGLVCDTVASQGQWTDTLRTYASCFVVQADSGLKFISDRPGSSVFSFGPAGDSKIVGDTLKLKKRGVQQVPTVMKIQYTDTTTTPWSTGTAEVLEAGVAAGTTERRESTVSLPGIQRYSQAYREAVERINKLTLGDMTAEFIAFDEALAVEVGDIVDLTSSLGLSAKMIRIGSVSSASPGRPRISATEYDPAMYSDVVQAEPTYADTNLPNPAAPPAVLGVTMNEEVFALESGTYASRWRITWTAETYPYLAHYRAELWAGESLIHTGSPTDAEWPTPAVKEGVTYTAKIAAVSSIGSVGEWGTQSKTAQGSQLIPGDVPSVTAFEAGGRVYGSAAPAVDIGVLLYEWRYWPLAGSWETGTLIDRLASLRMQTDQMPVGTWVLGVKAIDNVIKPGHVIGQYSTNAATTEVTVTSDSAAFLVDSYDSDTPTLTNMASYTLAPTDLHVYYVTEDGVAWDTKFSAALDTYTNPLSTYHNSVTSTWLGEPEDFGQLLGGQWTGTSTVVAIGGSYTSYIGLSDDNNLDPYDYTTGLSRKANGRFARLKHEALTTSTLGVTVPAQNIRLEAVAREESFSVTTSASVETTVTLDGEFANVTAIIVTPLGTTDMSYSINNIVLGSPSTFGIRLFSAGVQVAASAIGVFKGV